MQGVQKDGLEIKMRLVMTSYTILQGVLKDSLEIKIRLVLTSYKIFARCSEGLSGNQDNSV